ncbi:unnamed protein product [Blepharisma stoltei]|uniref:PDEase domain-containing protein n=1 Tax=Blepharisma stoltei TaxID=1481888 RepID=A0AAU9KHE9_9CILI|nr:unnamed protein product [Blepharisma stoltei]
MRTIESNRPPENPATVINIVDASNSLSDPNDYLNPSPVEIPSADDRKHKKRVKANIYYFILFMIYLANILTSNAIYENDITTILLCLIFLVSSFILNFIVVIYKQKYSLQDEGKKWVMPILYIYSGLAFVLSDLNIFPVLYRKDKNSSYLPGMQALLLLFVIGPKFLETKKSVYIGINAFLTIVSFGVNCFGNQSLGLSSFQVLLLGLATFYGLIDFKDFSKIGREIDYVQESILQSLPIPEYQTKSTTGMETIITAIKNTISVLLDAFEHTEYDNKETIVATITSLKGALDSLTHTNIYQTSFDQVTKNMDEQDKIYVSQAFFEIKPDIDQSSLSSKGNFKEKLNFIYGISDLSGILRQIGKEWNFNTIFIGDCSGQTPIQVVGMHVIRNYGLNELFSISDKSLSTFLRELEGRYLPNPYHNSCHAADVMCSYLYIIHSCPLIDETSSLELLAGIVSTLAHDAGHPAKTNRFLMVTKNDIAIQYNDYSVLEMMHATILFQVLAKNDCNILSNFASDKWFAIRKVIIELILATDMSKHFDLVEHFRARFIQGNMSVDFKNVETRQELNKMTIKMADIGHSAKSIELHEKLCVLVLQEFFSQGDLEKSLGLPVSMYCDKETTDIAKSQSGFIKNIALPLFIAMNNVVNSREIEENIINQLKQNEAYWNARRLVARNQTVLVKNDEDWINAQYKNLREKVDKHRRGSHPLKYLS